MSPLRTVLMKRQVQMRHIHQCVKTLLSKVCLTLACPCYCFSKNTEGVIWVLASPIF